LNIGFNGPFVVPTISLIFYCSQQDCKSIRVNKVATETSAVAVDAVNEVAELAVLLPFSK
jgi:hypothetical protein